MRLIRRLRRAAVLAAMHVLMAGTTMMAAMAGGNAAHLAVAGEPGASGASGGTVALVGPTWVAEDIGGRGVIDYLQSYITFTADGRAHGSGGCNNFSGEYALAGEMLDLGPLAGTKKGCPPAIMDQEARFYQTLGQTRGYRLDNGSCTCSTRGVRRSCGSGGAIDGPATRRRMGTMRFPP